MIRINCRQGTDEWLAARAGAFTASEFAAATSRLKRASGAKQVGDFTAEAERYCADVAVEQIYGKDFGQPARGWLLDRGHELEDQAKVRYMERTGSVVYEAGIVVTDDRLFGYSTDGEVDDDGLIEIKCPIDTLKIAAMMMTGDHSEYAHQIQGGLWITGRQWCDLIVYAPMLESTGNDQFVKRIYRDEAFIGTMVDGLMEAVAKMNQYKALFSRRAA